MTAAKQKYLFYVLVLSLIFLASCTHNTINQTTQLNTPQETKKPTAIEQQTIKIASFNIQIFGQTKIKNDEVMQIISKIVKQYDLVAIQEVRSTEQNVIPTLLNYINDANTKYDYIISERLGRSTSKEQYVFVYNTKTINLIPNSSYVAGDPDDVFEREPFIASFKAGNFDFTIVDNHVKPEDVEAELTHLKIEINKIYDGSSEKDVIVVGDMNADGSYFKEEKLAVILPEWTQMIGNNVDTTVGTADNTYDRMMTRDTTANVEYTGNSGAFRWDTEYNVTDSAFIKKVSDHYPVYAEFRVDLQDDD
ncbi:MAG: endonuclease/exonuclease/phosphatase family protein [Candidatus Firestonebacteria bacterium]